MSKGVEVEDAATKLLHGEEEKLETFIIFYILYMAYMTVAGGVRRFVFSVAADILNLTYSFGR